MKTKKQKSNFDSTETILPAYPTKYGYEQFILHPVKVINGCVSTVRS